MRRNLYFSNEFWSKLKKKAQEKDLKISQYIRNILIEYWKKEEK